MREVKKETGSVAAEAPSTIGSQINSNIDLKENQELMGKDAVALIKTVYPGFDHSLYSKSKRPDIYGIHLVAGARKMLDELRPRKKAKRSKADRWSFRVTKTTHSRLQTAMQKRGIKSKQTFIEAIVLKWLEENENVGRA